MFAEHQPIKGEFILAFIAVLARLKQAGLSPEQAPRLLKSTLMKNTSDTYLPKQKKPTKLLNDATEKVLNSSPQRKH